jgi:hypothetical protein
MAKVYVTQESGSVDYLPACAFGDLVFVTGSGQRISHLPQSIDTQLVMEQINTVLADFDSDEDYLLCTGSPTIMAICGATLGEDLHKILSWDNRAHKYFEVII